MQKLKTTANKKSVHIQSIVNSEKINRFPLPLRQKTKYFIEPDSFESLPFNVERVLKCMKLWVVVV